MKSLPEWMYIDGIVYYYEEWKGNNKLSDWFFCGLFSKDKHMPPNVKVSNSSYIFLCSAEFSMEKAREDLLNRINSMIYDIH